MTDYMATEHEMKKQPDALETFQRIANGDAAVFNALWSFWNMAHVFDDLLDGSGWPEEKKEQAMKALHDFVVDLLLNPFIRQNAAELRGLFVMAMTRALDGDRFEKSRDAFRKSLAPAVRCGDIDVIMGIAYLARGWGGLRQFSNLRDYDPPDERAQ